MVFSCVKSYLQDALALAGRAVSSRATNQILECVLIVAEPDVGVRVIGNDKEICIETAAIHADVEQAGAIALDAKLFSEIVRRLPGELIVVETDDALNAICKSGRSRLKIAGQHPDDFPVVAENEFAGVDSRFKLNAADLRELIKQTIFSVSNDQSRPILTGEKFEIKNSILEVVAVDMFRISYASANIGDDSAASAVIPAKALNELARSLPDDGEVSFFFTESKAVFETDGFRLVCSLLAGEFIRYDQIYNEDFSTMVIVERLPLLGVFERAVLVATENRMLPVKLVISDDDITVSAQSERGSVEDGVPCETEGKDITIYFNPRYYIDVLRALSDERVVIKLNTVLTPCVIRGHDTDSGLRYLIVPLRPPE